MKDQDLFKALSLEYNKNKSRYSDPMELLEHIVDVHSLNEKNKRNAMELAEEIYFGYDAELYEYNKDR